MKAAVIGSGIGGLAIAVRLAVKGWNVTVFEKNGKPGGKLSEIRMNGYRFDTGPSLFTLPEMTAKLFKLCGEEISEKLPYKLLENNCRYFYDDNTVFNFYHDKEKLKAEIENKTTENPENIFRRLEKSEEMYTLSAPVFLFSSFHKISNFNTEPYKKIALRLHKLDFFRTIHQANSSDFTDPKMIQLFDRYATYNGSNPYKAPATLNMIAHLENNLGAFFPLKGMYSIVENIYQLALKQGVKFRFNTLVDKIIVENGKVNVLKYGEQTENFDVIVSDSDSRYVSENMLEKHPLKNRLAKSELSSSALIFYWGINKVFNELDVHNILFSSDYKTEFRKITIEKTLSDDPTVYIFVSSKICTDDAPAGCENWFVMINTPAHNQNLTDEVIQQARKNIIRKINQFLKTDIEKFIECEQFVTPFILEKRTLSKNGALYGSSSNSMFAAFLRHPNSLRSIKNLYFTGGSVHPGGGIPLCMASAEIVDNEIPALK